MKDSERNIEELRDEKKQDQRKFEDARRQTEKALAELRTESAQRETELTEALDQAIQQRDLVGEMVSELFQVPEDVIVEILTPRSPSEAVRTDQEIESLRAQFRSMKRLPGSGIAKHLLTYEELRKRCDIWDVYVAANGLTTFTIGTDTHQFRADTSDDFERTLFERYKASPQPKGLVIILLSYGDTRASTYEAAVNGLPKAAERMREDSNARTRFEYAILGYSPKEVER